MITRLQNNPFSDNQTFDIKNLKNFKYIKKILELTLAAQLNFSIISFIKYTQQKFYVFT